MISGITTLHHFIKNKTTFSYIWRTEKIVIVKSKHFLRNPHNSKCKTHYVAFFEYPHNPSLHFYYSCSFKNSFQQKIIVHQPFKAKTTFVHVVITVKHTVESVELKIWNRNTFAH